MVIFSVIIIWKNIETVHSMMKKGEEITMRLWIRMSVVFFSVLVGLAVSFGSANASAPAEPTLELEFKDLPDYFVVGKTYKLEVESLSMDGEVKKAEFAFEGDTNKVVENVETVLTDNGKHFKITGDFTPKKKGNYTLKFTIGVGEENRSYTVDSITAKIRVLNEGDIFVPGNPEVVESKMTTSTSKYEVGKKITFTVSTPKKGTMDDDAKFELLFRPNGDEKVTGTKTVQSTFKYTTTGYFIPQQEGEYTIRFRLLMTDEKGKQWEGIAEKGIKVKREELKNVRVGFVPLVHNPSLRAGGQVVLIAKIPKQYAKQGYHVTWSDNVTGLEGPTSSDHSYTYVVGIFKAEKTGEHYVRFKAMLDHQWVGEVSMKILVEE
ncbi:MAG: hypothetical protein K0R47_14 [Brevibacillus sp.]|nr:hypothetical protein [Brevibacillus sp.]